MATPDVRKPRRQVSASPHRTPKKITSSRRERDSDDDEKPRRSEKDHKRSASVKEIKRSSDKDEKRHSSVKEIRKSSSSDRDRSDRDRRKSTTRDSKLRTSSPDVKKHSSSHGSESRRRSNRHRTSTKETKERGRSGRPRMSRDQMLSIRHLFASDDDGPDNDEKVEKQEKQEKQEKKERKKAERDEEKERKKREKKKKKARDLKEQMDRRAMLNMQFTSIRRMLDGSEFLDEGPKPKPKLPVADDDHTVNFDPFAPTPMTTKSETPSRPSLLQTSAEKEISFRDLLADKSSRGLSFRDLMKSDADEVIKKTSKPSQQNQFHMSCIVDMEEEEGNEDNDDSADFEAILWGDLDEVNEVTDDDEGFKMLDDHFRVDNSTSGNDFDRSFSISISENTFSSNAGSVNSSGFPCPRSPTKKNRRFEVADEHLSPRSVKSDQQHSVNTHNSTRSETDTPSHKKKKKDAESGRSREKQSGGGSRTPSPGPAEGGRKPVKRTHSGQAECITGVSDSMFACDTPGTTVKRGVGRTLSPTAVTKSPTVTNQAIDFDFDPQKANCSAMMAMQGAPLSSPRKGVKKTSSGDKNKGIPPLSPLRSIKSKKKPLEDDIIETSNHVFVE